MITRLSNQCAILERGIEIVGVASLAPRKDMFNTLTLVVSPGRSVED